MQSVFDYKDSLKMQYGVDTSIFLDACFLLINFEEGNEHDKEKVATIIEKWKQSGVELLAISNHVAAECIYHIFKIKVESVIETVYQKKIGNIEDYTQDQEDNIIDIAVANRLFLSGLDGRFRKRIIEEKPPRFFFSVPKLMKRAKNNMTQQMRETLDIYYSFALRKFDLMIRMFEEDFIVARLESMPDDLITAKDYMLRFRLEPYDALHLAIAKRSGCTFFATLDGDFKDVEFVTEDKSNTFVLQLRNEVGKAAWM